MHNPAVNERIKMLYEHFGDGNVSAFARSISVNHQTVRDLMKGDKGGPSWPVIQNILQAFPSVSLQWLMLGIGPMLKSDTADASLKNNLTATPNPVVELHIERPDLSGNRVVPVINYKAAANYLTGYQSQELYEELEMLSLPRELLPGKGRYIIFPVTGDSMEPTLWAEDLILCQHIRPERWLELRGTNLLVVVSRSHGIQVKRARVIKSLRSIHCQSDNPLSVPFYLSLNDEGDNQSDVLELWTVERFISKRLEAPEQQSTQRINYIENKVDDLHYLLETILEEREIARRLRERDQQKKEATNEEEATDE